MSAEPTDSGPEDLVPASVRLGAVVPPEDPEDWTRPLTWMAALGILAAPLIALAWFTAVAPRLGEQLLPGAWVVAAALAVGAAAVGATQIGGVRAFAGTAVAALLGALLTLIVSVVLAGERQIGSPSHTVALALVAGIGGSVGALAAAMLAPFLAAHSSRGLRWLAPAGIGAAVAVLTVALISNP